MAFLLGILNGTFSNTGEVSFTFAQTIFYSQLGFFFLLMVHAHLLF